MKKIMATTILACSLLSAYAPVFAATDEVTVSKNSGARANVHQSTRHIATDGSYGYTTAKTYDGTKIYYINAKMSATYSNGQVQGGSVSNPKYNSSESECEKVYENGSKRQYHSSAEAKNTSSSAMEYTSGKSVIFD